MVEAKLQIVLRRATTAQFPAAMACLKIPFPDYSLDIVADGGLRLVLPSADFAAERVSGDSRRELSRGASICAVADYTDTRLTLRLDSSAQEAWSFTQEGVAIVQELNGVVAKTSRGIFQATSARGLSWTIEREEFGKAFDPAKSLLPLLSKGISAPVLGTQPSGLSVPLSTREKPHGAELKVGLRFQKKIPQGTPLFGGVTTGGHLEVATDFQHHFSVEVIAGVRIAGIFPGGAFFKVEFEALPRNVLPGTDNTVSAGTKADVVLAVGVYATEEHKMLPFEFEWELFLGIGFVREGQPGTTSIGLGIIFHAAGSVQYPAAAALVEVGVKVEGQGLVAFENEETIIVCKGSLAIEIAVAFILDIEWEIVEGEIARLTV